jgi:hypothetical protein
MTADSHLQTVAELGLRILQSHLPEGWTLYTALAEGSGRSLIPQEALLAAPGSRKVRVRLHVARDVESPQIGGLADSADRVLSPSLIITPLLKRETRERLTTRGINFVDLSGNTHFSLLRPAVSVDVQGASSTPSRAHTSTKLSGSKTARVVRALCDFRSSTDCAEIASRAGVGVAHASRIVRSLAHDGLVVMTGAHRIESADWPALLRRWSDDDRGRVRQFRWYVAPRGIAAFASQLKNRQDCVISGPWAANAFAPLTTKQLLICYVRDAEGFAEQLDLEAAGTTANVAVSRQWSDAVMEGTWEYGGIRIVALAQIAADLLTLPLESTARPVLEWMRDNERAWRR